MPEGIDLRNFAPAGMSSVEDDPLVNLPVEQALLGALLLDVGLLDSLPPGFHAESYADTRHTEIHRAIAAVAETERNNVLHHVTTATSVTGDQRRYLVNLTAAVADMLPASITSYGKIILGLHRSRKVQEICRKVIEDAKRLPADGLIARTLGQLDMLASDQQQDGQDKSFNEAMDEALKDAEDGYKNQKPPGISTGFKSLDEPLRYMQPGHLLILGGRPGMGKSALAVQALIHRGQEAKAELEQDREYQGGIFFASLEMPAKEVANRVLSYMTGLDADRIQRGKLTQSEFDLLFRSRKHLDSLPVEISDAAGLSMAVIALKARAAQRKLGGLSLIVIDHFNIISPDEKDTKTGSGSWMSDKISNALKRMAKAFNCPVLCLAQLSRDVDKRDNKRPILSDLRWAGALEQDADRVMFLYREYYYLMQQGRPEKREGESGDQFSTRLSEYDAKLTAKEHDAEWILAKARGGKPCTVNLLFDGPTTSFSEPETYHQ